MADEFTLKYDSTAEQLVGEDPDTGNRVPVPFESLSTDDINIADDIQVARDSAELSNLLANGRTIYLLDKIYNIDDINDRCKIIGTAPRDAGTGSSLRPDTSDTVTVSGRAQIRGVNLTVGCEVTADFLVTILNCWLGNNTVTVSGTNRLQIIGCDEGTITLDSNTEDCVVDSCTVVSVTDNGTNNVVGDNT